MSFLQKNQLVFLFCLLITCLSCHDKEALRRTMIKKMVKEKVENHKRKRITTCNKNALEEALEVADSLMIKTALSQVDTSNQVNRPAKPSRPDINLPVDTTPIKPLFKETIIPTLDTSSLVQKPKLINKDSLLNKSILHYKN